MFQAFQELFERLGLKRTRGRRSFALEAELHDAVLKRAGIERREADGLIAELVATGLKRIENEDWLSITIERNLLSFLPNCAIIYSNIHQPVGE
jgi:hypothetical protein